jgi:hypothetical protein
LQRVGSSHDYPAVQVPFRSGQYVSTITRLAKPTSGVRLAPIEAIDVGACSRRAFETIR